MLIDTAVQQCAHIAYPCRPYAKEVFVLEGQL